MCASSRAPKLHLQTHSPCNLPPSHLPRPRTRDPPRLQPWPRARARDLLDPRIPLAATANAIDLAPAAAPARPRLEPATRVPRPPAAATIRAPAPVPARVRLLLAATAATAARAATAAAAALAAGAVPAAETVATVVTAAGRPVLAAPKFVVPIQATLPVHLAYLLPPRLWLSASPRTFASIMFAKSLVAMAPFAISMCP